MRDILFSRYRQQIAELRAEVDDLERQVTDREALVSTISPLLGDLIRRKVRDAREEMVDALYPIIGQVVVRAVQEAIRDLARTIDARMRSTFSPRALWRRLRARAGRRLGRRDGAARGAALCGQRHLAHPSRDGAFAVARAGRRRRACRIPTWSAAC